MRLTAKRTLAGWSLASLVATLWLSACGDGFSGSCAESRTCQPNSGGAAGQPEPVGAGSAADGGTVSGDAGEASSSSGAGGGGTMVPSCPEGYQSWVTSSFSFPDGGILGSPDFPSQPWISSGGLEIDSGRLTGLGRASVGQGGPLPYDGLRLRFRARFTDSGQAVIVEINGAREELIGLSVTLDSTGSLLIREGDNVAAERTLAPLETGSDLFVEAAFVESSAEVTVARGNYGSESQADIAATLSGEGLQLAASGVRTAVELQGAGALAPSLDELSLDRCGLPPPSYENLFLDNFERADSTALGAADFPIDADWTTSGPSARIIDGALEVSSLASATVPLETVSGDGLRIRATLQPTTASHWLDLNYNASSSADDHPLLHHGFWIWGDSAATYSKIFLGNMAMETKHEGVALLAGEDYFVELNRDDGSGLLTVRSGSFSGPIIVVNADDGLVSTDDAGEYLRLSTSGSVATRFGDVRIDRYGFP